ncbi:MAG: intradiol ring-cleavage dioxygenase [Anaerolineales bacterium]|nr:intradiol ring-cleavage dioxygenase [Anaerolineales bacterium]
MDASPNNIPAAQTETATPVPATEPTADIFSALEMPVCSGVTPQDQEGPYYTPNTPEKNSLLEESMQGDKLILIGYVLNAECQPIANAWLDFWQADANGEYDNTGYTLRGHQFTDEQGRYYLETIIPGLYSSRPIRHIHVKVQAPNAEILTTQLYFPEQPIEGLTVQLTETEGQYQAIYNFILP